ncbi:hypothetical protein AJ80_07664 [Polytolypa hystricis UAMH7299]|uniref:Wax synthase domain-containing protein n=1 Tax=Polytolypa hystricis (strain UAMH7299) TaxID=1447883 RepID=A0A2B7XL09_POLH7|nr:hypothetical protein AJ80_07664 [Polytolypa hystricis UAMH7299]
MTDLLSNLLLPPSPETQAALRWMVVDIYTGLVSLSPPTLLLYFALYALVKQRIRVFGILAWLAAAGYVWSSLSVVLTCSVVRSVQLFAVAVGVMKSLDFFARRHNPPQYTESCPPPDATIALLYLTELRYESFTPNYIHKAPAPTAVPKPENTSTSHRLRNHIRNHKPWLPKPNFSEPANLLLHTLAFSVLQTRFPQSNSTVLALQVLLAIYILWETLQLVLRYKSSPPLFGPVYTASSLGTFWSETWHSAFASPCRSLAYDPLRRCLTSRYAIPTPIARAVGMITAFALMGAFHVYAMTPLLPEQALWRIFAFFVMNGIGTVIEDAIWKRHTHWGKTILAWVFELAIASWTVEGLEIPKGLGEVRVSDVCNIGKG